MAGYHGRGGPAPDPNALRRDRPSDAAGWVTLPAEGRTDPAPEFPLPTPSPRELEVWTREWSRPQAVQWEALGLDYEVGLYVRAFVEAELPGAASTVRNFVRMTRDNLGLSVGGLARNRWRIAGPSAPATVTPIRATTIRPGSGNRSSRNRSGQAGTPALDLLARWRAHGTTFPPDTKQHADAVAELAARGIDLDPYDYLDQRRA